MTPYGVTECLTPGPGLTCLHDITCVPLFTQHVMRMGLKMFAYHRTSFCTRYWLWWWWWILSNNCHYNKQLELSLHSLSIEWYSPCLHNITPTMIHLALPWIIYNRDNEQPPMHCFIVCSLLSPHLCLLNFSITQRHFRTNYIFLT